MNRIFTVLFLALVFDLTSQNGIDNDKAHRRYWFYRTRMINDFMKIGKNQGDCIIMAERNPNQRTNPSANVGPDQMDISNHYIMALALEYKLLTRGNQSTDETVKEIWHMLYAVNRLDKEANQFWSSNPPTYPSLTQNTPMDGFMIREDLPPNYYDNLHNENDFNFSKKEYNYNPQNPPTGFCGTEYINKLGGYFPTASNPNPSGSKFQEYLNNPTLANKDGMGIPTDKFHSLLTALLFVIKYLPDQVNYYENGTALPFQDSEISIKQEARNIAFRVYNYMRNGFQGTNSWVLQYPDYNGPTPIGNGHILNVGAFADIYSYPLTRMACNANNGYPFAFANVNCLNNNFGDNTSNGIGVLSYNSQAITAGATQDNAVFKAWDHVGSNMPAGIIPIAAAMQANTNSWNLKWANLARIVLHQTDNINVAESDYTSIIAQAPCTGPFNFSSKSSNNCSEIASCAFSAQDWLEKPDYRNSNCSSCGSMKENPFTGNYPGADYMLLHNLYYEYHNQLLFENSLGGTGGLNANGAAGLPGGVFAGNSYIYMYNFFANVASATGSGINALTTTACNIANSISSFFNGSTICNGTSLPSIPTIPAGNSAGSFSSLAYIGYNFMDNYDNSVWPKQLYNGPQPPFIPGNGSFSNNNPFSPNNPNNPNSPYNPSNPNGFYSNPANFLFQGTIQSQGKVGMYQNLTSTAHIYANTSPAAPFNNMQSDVRYRAGKEITLLPGFQVDAGSNFYAYVKRYLCNVDGDALQMRQSNQNDSLLHDIDNAHYETDFVNQMPLHYVEHPKSDADLFQYNNNSSTANEFSDQSQNYLVEQYNKATIIKDRSMTNDLLNEAAQQRFIVLPNPNNGIFKIFANKIALDEVFSVSVFDMKGQQIIQHSGLKENVSLEVDFTQYSKGIYLVNITTNYGYKNSKKISVN